MAYLAHSANLTGLSSLRIIPSMKTGSSGKKSKKKMPRKNQFGVELAQALPTTVFAWQCSVCGNIMPLADVNKPPVRCSKKGCRRLFYNEGKSEI